MSSHHGALVSRLAALLTLGALTLAAASLRAAGPPPSPVHLKVLFVRFLSFAPLAIAEAEGYFRSQGLEVEPVTLTGSNEATPPLIRGELDVVTGLIKIGDFNAIARGASLRLVADKGHFEAGPCAPMAFVARPGLMDGEGANEPARLRRARVAASPLSYVEYALETLLSRKGLKLTDVNLARMHEGMVGEAIEKGSLDIGVLAEPNLSRAVKSGKAVLWAPFPEFLPEGQLAAIYFGPGLLERNRDAGRRFMVAYLQGVRQYNRGKTPRNLDILVSATGLDRELLKEACWQPIRGDGRINVESVLDFQRWAVRRGALDAVVPAERFWDPSFVEEATRVLGPPKP
ncbi:MAG TPA: ABC transporter substrate-binding protein [Thermoanaerobaculia bacterium]|nr:ABC transporter substrate-binding protein [Thermoanaerobaculia bacterium]